MAKKKTNEEFKKQLEERNPNIIPLEPYVTAITKLQCKCRICGHEWPGIPNNLLRGEGCPNCSGNIAWTTESFIQEMRKRNPSITIVGVYKNNKTHIKYVCSICGETGSAVPSSLLRGHGCKYCGKKQASQKRRKTNEEFLKQLAEKNPGVLPLEEYVNFSTAIRCQCVCGNTWSTTPSHLLSGQKCRQCQTSQTDRRNIYHSGKRKSNEQFQKELLIANPTIEALEEYTGIKNKMLFRCKDCGYEWRGWPRSQLRGQGCRKCQKRWSTSFPEQAIYYYIRKEYSDAINSYRNGLGKSEIDIYIPSKRMGIEYDGRNWHRNSFQKECDKYNRCKSLGIELIRIRESELQGDVSQICDYFIASEYGHTKRFNSLDNCISELMEFLKVQRSVDTQRDKLSIMEQYYSSLHDKSLGVLYPELSEEWYQPKNGTITPFMVLPKSNESFWWECSACKNIYPSYVSSRTTGHGCPKCAGTERKTQNAFVEEMKSINPEIEIIGKYINANMPIEFRCRICGKIDQSQPRSLKAGAGCKACARKKTIKLKSMPESIFLERAQKLYPDIEIIGQYINNKERIVCKCKRCNNTWSPIAQALVSGNTGCTVCAGVAKKAVRCIETGVIYNGLLHSLISYTPTRLPRSI